MKRRIFSLILVAFFSAVFLFAGSGLVLAEGGFGDTPVIDPGTSVPTQDVNQVKEKFERFKSFLQDSEGNLFQWVGGQIIGEGNAEVIREHGLLGAIEYGFLTQLIGIPKDGGGSGNGSGGGSGGAGYNPNTPSSIPMGAIIMPPGDWYFSGGMVGATNNMIAATLSTPAASGVYYAYDVLHNLGVAPAYAAGGAAFGGGGGTLKPILGIWKAFRNVTYSLFAIVFVIVGLMVMFRVRTSPQTVLTIETALPRVIGILILITFSYAIAGFMIDLMYVVMGLVVTIMRSSGAAGLWPPAQNTAQIVSEGAPVGLIMEGLGYPFAGGLVITVIIGAIAGFVITGLTSGGTTIAGLILFVLIFVIVLIVLMLKLFFALIKTYINIILLIIFAPIYIMVGVLPNSSIGFGSWLKNFVANLLVFPAVFLVMILMAVISGKFASLGLWRPPLMMGYGFLSLLFVNLGFLFVLPSVPDIVRGMMGIKDSGIGATVSQGFGPIKSAASMGVFAGSDYIAERSTQGKIGRYLGSRKDRQAPGRAADALLEIIKKKAAS